MSRSCARFVAIASVLAVAATAARQSVGGQCEPGWFGGRGVPGTNGPVYASASWDPDGPGGQGPMPVVGGSFNIAGNELADNVAGWNGSEWIALGDGIPGTNSSVLALAVYDDGKGPALYAGGFFNVAGGAPADYIARWDGTSWSPVGTGMDGRVEALAVFDDGDGPALYAGGGFLNAGGQLVRFIAKWDGTRWSPLGAGMNSWVLTLTVFDDGNGAALYAGGQFTSAGGIGARFAAKWDGGAWSDLDTGEVDGVINDLTTYDDGGGVDLYACGEFTFIGTEAVALFIARWNGTRWSSLGAGMNDVVNALTVFDNGGPNGPALYAGGNFTSAGIVSAGRIASWNGTAWSSLGSGLGSTVTTMTVVEDDGRGGPATLYAGGFFNSAGDAAASNVASWDGTNWATLGTGTGINAGVRALVAFDDGSGPALHAAGGFATAGGTLANCIAKWDSTTWSPLGAGMNFEIYALAVYNGGTRGAAEALYAGGWFTAAGGSPASYIASWDGAGWSPVGTGTSYVVRALTVFDDGNGPALYAGGAFTAAGGASADFIAKWDGKDWSPLSTGMNNYVYVMTEFNDGNGPALYAGGEFTTAGGKAANFIAKWDGSDWQQLGSGLNGAVYALASFDDGTGSALYAGGFYSMAGAEAASCIARWNGAEWSPVGAGMSGGSFPAVLALEAFDDGGGPALYAGGQFTTADGVGAVNIARWDGLAWSPLSTGVEGTPAPAVRALTVFDDGSGPALYAGGTFNVASGRVSAHWARWGPTWGDLTGEGLVAIDDWAPFAECLAGPGAGTVAGCDCADIDADGDVDLGDYARFQDEFR